MDQFFIFLKMGFDHISDFNGFDHMLFIIVLCAQYKLADWRKVAVLITAFTIGHCTTLALASLKIILVNSKVVEVLIPATIFFTSIHNLFSQEEKIRTTININYIIALAFGLIHGMGFSNFFNALMSDSMNITLPLFAFNLGLEVGQLLIIALFFSFQYVLKIFWNFEQRAWTLFLSGAGAGISLTMVVENLKMVV